jgi:fused signal recognition particle receptor
MIEFDAVWQWGVLALVGGAGLVFAIRSVLRRLGAEERPESRESEAPEMGGTDAERLRAGLSRTRNEGFLSKLTGLFGGDTSGEEAIEEIEAILYTADIGVKTSKRLLSSIREGLSREEWADEAKVRQQLREESQRILAAAHAPRESKPTSDGAVRPHVLMVVGVNGAGKTTTIGKIASQLKAEGSKVLLAAGDTFRAAAVEQLQVWADRVEVDLWKGEEGADPASVLFEAVRHAIEEGHDVVLADTSGRLHTDANLMRELEKVHRVLGKARDGAPDEVLLVLDATMGQNAIQQARQFGDAVAVTGLVLTKLDGTARGGVVLGICDEMGLPIRHVGIGERVEDLRPFSVEGFVDALFAPPEPSSGP